METMRKQPRNIKRGLYVSYNEENNGPFAEAVRISNDLGSVTWLDNFHLNPKNLEYPTDIVVKLKGEERYFRGILLAVASADDLAADFLEGERNHRPSNWRKRPENFKSVLFISHLEEVSEPSEVRNRPAPEHPIHL